MAFNDTYRESIQTKHIANVGFTSTAKGASNESNVLINPHQILASQIPATDVVGTYGALVADGISAGLVEKHTIKLTADATVNDNKAWYATENNCTETEHAARGTIRVNQWMRYGGTQYKLRLFEDDGSGTAPNMSAEILPSEVNFNWEYDASAGIVYFDEDPSANGKTLPLWGILYTYIGSTVADSLDTTSSGLSDNYDLLNEKIDTVSGTLRTAIEAQNEFIELGDTISSYNTDRILFESDAAVVDDANFTYVSGTQMLNVPNIDATGNISIDGTLGFDSGTTVDEFITAINSSSTDDQVPTALSVYTHVDVVSGTLQSQIDTNASNISSNDTDIYNNALAISALDSELTTVSGYLQSQIDTNASNISSNYTTLDNKIDTTSGTLQSAIDAMGEAHDTFIELTDTINSFNAERILFESGTAVVDDANFTYVSGTQTLNVPNIDSTGNISLDGTLGFDTGTTINEFVTSVSSSSTDDQVPTSLAVYSYVNSVSGTLQDGIDNNATDITNNYNTLDSKIDTTSGTLQSEIDNLDTSLNDAIIWEVVDTPFEQIRPKIEHQGKAIYTAGNLTIGGDLTVSGTTTTVHSQELTVTDKVITVNAGEVGSGITGDQYAGIEVDRGSEANYMFVFDEVQDNFRVGISGSLQAVATREDAPTDTRVPWWNDSAIRFDTAGNTYQTIVTTSGAGAIEMVTDTASVVSLTDDTQRFGTTAGGYISTDSNSVDAYIGVTQIMTVSADSQVIGVSGDTTIALTQSTDAVVISSAGTTELTINTNGMSLKSGASVNEIVSSTGDISAASTDDQIATNLLIYNELNTLSGTLQSVIDALDHNTDLASMQGGTEDEYYHLTNNEYSAFSSDGSTWTFSQAMALATGTSVNEIVDSTGDLSESSTDDQLATAKLIYNEIAAISGTVGALTFLDLTDTPSSYQDGYIITSTAGGITMTATLDHNTDLSGMNGGTIGEYYHLTSNEYSAFSSDGTTWTFSQAMALAAGGSVNEVSTTVDVSSTDSQLPTAKAVYDYVEAKPTTFLGLTDTISSFTDQRILFTTASGVVDNANFTFDSSTGTLSVNYLDLEIGGSVNEIITTVTSGTTDSQIPTAKAVWDLTEAAAAAVHIHYDVDGVYVSDTSWTYGTGFAATPDGLQIFVNGVKQRIGVAYDCSVDVPGGVLTITFNYNVYSGDWVNITYYA